MPKDIRKMFENYPEHVKYQKNNLNINFQDDEFRTPVYNKESMESNTKGVYLAGVVCGGYKTNKWFIENSREHAVKVMEAIAKT